MEASKALAPIDKEFALLDDDKHLIPPVNSPRYRNCSDNIALAIAQGCSIAGIAQEYGLSRNTIHEWFKSGHFQALVKRKRDEIRQLCLNRIMEAGEKPHLWAANSWILERSPAFKGEYAQPKAAGSGAATINVQINVGSSPGGPDGVRVQIGQEPDDD